MNPSLRISLTLLALFSFLINFAAAAGGAGEARPSVSLAAAAPYNAQALAASLCEAQFHPVLRVRTRSARVRALERYVSVTEVASAAEVRDSAERFENTRFPLPTGAPSLRAFLTEVLGYTAMRVEDLLVRLNGALEPLEAQVLPGMRVEILTPIGGASDEDSREGATAGAPSAADAARLFLAAEKNLSPMSSSEVAERLYHSEVSRSTGMRTANILNALYQLFVLDREAQLSKMGHDVKPHWVYSLNPIFGQNFSALSARRQSEALQLLSEAYVGGMKAIPEARAQLAQWVGIPNVARPSGAAQNASRREGSWLVINPTYVDEFIYVNGIKFIQIKMAARDRWLAELLPNLGSRASVNLINFWRPEHDPLPFALEYRNPDERWQLILFAGRGMKADIYRKALRSNNMPSLRDVSDRRLAYEALFKDSALWMRPLPHDAPIHSMRPIVLEISPGIRKITGVKPLPTSVPVERPTVGALVARLPGDPGTLARFKKYMVVTVASGDEKRKVGVTDERYDIPENAHVSIRLEDQLEPEPPLMRRLIGGKPSPAALAFIEAVRRVDAAYHSGATARVKELVAEARFILRNDVPQAERAFAERVSLLTGEALVKLQIELPQRLNQKEFLRRVLGTIGDRLEEAVLEEITLHSTVADTVYINSVLSGELFRMGEASDPARIFRRRCAARGDDSALRNASMKVAVAVIRGIHQWISGYQGTTWIDSLESILDKGVQRGLRAHGVYNDGALDSNGTLAMRSFGRVAPRRAFRSARLNSRAPHAVHACA